MLRYLNSVLFDLVFYSNNSTQFQSSIYHKVNDKLELGIKKGWSTDKTDTKFSVAAKYSVDKDLVLRVSRLLSVYTYVDVAFIGIKYSQGGNCQELGVQPLVFFRTPS